MSRVQPDYVTGSREHPTNEETAPRFTSWWYAITFTASLHGSQSCYPTGIIVQYYRGTTVLNHVDSPTARTTPTIIKVRRANERPSTFCFPRRRGTVAIVSARMGVNLCVLTDGGCSPDIARRPLIFNPHREAATAAATMRRARRFLSARAHSRAPPTHPSPSSNGFQFGPYGSRFRLLQRRRFVTVVN